MSDDLRDRGQVPPAQGVRFTAAPQQGARNRLGDRFWEDDADSESYLLDLIGIEDEHFVAQGIYEHFAPWSVRVELTDDLKTQLVWFAERILERFRRSGA